MINQWPFTREFTPFSLPSPSALPWFPSRHSTGSGHYPRASEGTTPLLRGGDLPRKKKMGDALGFFFVTLTLTIWYRRTIRAPFRTDGAIGFALRDLHEVATGRWKKPGIQGDWSKNLQETMVFTRKKNLRPVRITFFSREEATCQRFFGNLWDILIILIS